jgi:hypothetical protein
MDTSLIEKVYGWARHAAGGRPLLTPAEILGLRPMPLYIQYQ